MSESNHVAALRRKLRAPSAARGRNGAEDAVRRLVPRIVEDDFGVEARLAALDERIVPVSEAVDGSDAAPLMLGLGAEGTAPVAIAIADPELVAAVIEMETTGAITSIRRDARAPTTVDAALVGRVVLRWMQAIRTAVGPEFLPVVQNSRLFADTRAVLLAVDDGPARVVRVDLDFDSGKRRGRLDIVVPLAVGSADTPGEEDGAGPQLADVEVSIVAVLACEKIALGRLHSLAVGDLLTLEDASLRRVTVEAPRGTKLTAARLGQSGGRRAVRLTSGVPDREGGAGPDGTGSLPGPVGARPKTEDGIPVPETDTLPMLDPPGDGPGSLPALPPVADALPAPDEVDLPPLPDDLLPDAVAKPLAPL